MLNPLAILVRYALDRAAQSGRLPFLMRRQANWIAIGIPASNRFNDVRTVTLVGGDVELSVAHTAPSEYFSDEIVIRSARYRTDAPYPRWPDEPLRMWAIGPLEVVVNTAAHQRRQRAAFVVKQAAEKAAAATA